MFICRLRADHLQRFDPTFEEESKRFHVNPHDVRVALLAHWCSGCNPEDWAQLSSEWLGLHPDQVVHQAQKLLARNGDSPLERAIYTCQVQVLGRNVFIVRGEVHAPDPVRSLSAFGEHEMVEVVQEAERTSVVEAAIKYRLSEETVNTWRAVFGQPPARKSVDDSVGAAGIGNGGQAPSP